MANIRIVKQEDKTMNLFNVRVNEVSYHGIYDYTKHSVVALWTFADRGLGHIVKEFVNPSRDLELTLEIEEALEELIT